MKILINYTINLILVMFLSACGTGKYLGFEKRKVPLEGKRVSVLKDIKVFEKDILSTSKVILSDPIEIKHWKQSFNSPKHISLNYLSNSKLSKFSKIASGKGEDDDEKILAQPLIYKNTLFFMDAKSVIYSFNLKTKKINWKKKLITQNEKGHNIGGGIAVDDNFLFVGSPYAEIFCISLEDGKIIWKKNSATPIRATPTLIENKVIILTLDNRTMVFDKNNGNLIWEHQGIQSSTSLLGQPKVAVDGNLVLLPYSNGDIFALNLTNGAEIWRQSSVNIEQSETTNSFTDIDANPVMLKNLIVIASTSGKVLAFNKKNGNQVWQQYLNTTQTPLINGNSIYVIHNNKEVVNLDTKNGKVRWIYEIEKEFLHEEGIWLTPVLINSKLVLVGGDRSLIVLSAINGKFEKKYNLPDFPITPPIVVNRKVFLMLKNSAVYLIE